MAKLSRKANERRTRKLIREALEAIDVIAGKAADAWSENRSDFGEYEVWSWAKDEFEDIGGVLSDGVIDR